MSPNGYIAAAAFAIIVLCAVALLSGCGTTGHVGVMHEFGGDPDTSGQDPLCTFAVKKELSARITAQYLHVSWCSSGEPFNDNPESTMDAIGVEAQIW